MFLQPLLTFGYSQAENTSQTAPSPLIIISIDGMRADYIDRFNPPAISKLAKEGVRAKWMIPSFPTKTFPNHYTIVTGLYPAHHGIVENNIYDFGTVFTMGNRQEVRSSRWWGGEPIWVTAEKQGLRAASYFFVGTEAEIGGVKLKLRRDYNGKVPNDLRIDTVLRWLDLPASERPSLILMYFSDVDDVGHEFGPDAEETKYAVWDVDRSIARLVEGLTKRGILDKTNIILVSDHGMAAVNPNSAVFFDDYLDLNDAQQILWT
ncbi:MAG TPA: ectonucleotide pyrophosphatase/phosphodiesterase, partial [Pyrinomonadaceae bacterium]|nr:ectonucleotide pyrophosphatase/phosphodiesterase [Pyrinomonadaceae bacterium]